MKNDQVTHPDDVAPMSARQAFRLGLPETAPYVTGTLDWRKSDVNGRHQPQPAPSQK